MPRSQATTSDSSGAGFTLHIERLGPLPLINHFIERIGVHNTLTRVGAGVDPRLFAGEDAVICECRA
jgi:hypothetical protein